VPDEKSVMVALTASTSGDHHGPACAIVTFTLPYVLHLLAEVDQARRLRADDDRVRAVLRTDFVTWLNWGSLAEELLAGELGEAHRLYEASENWVVVPVELAGRIATALDDPDPDSGVTYRAGFTERRTDHDDVHWKGRPKHGDFGFETAALSAADLERLLAEHLLPGEARFYYKTTVIIGIKDGRVTHAEVGEVLGGLPDAWVNDASDDAEDPVACPPALGRVVGRLIDADLTGPEGRALHRGVIVYDPEPHPLSAPFIARAG
jgi:hypothetical protein